MSDAKVDLGRRLFYDARLSGNQTYACATCHQQELAFTDGRAQAIGSTGGVHRTQRDDLDQRRLQRVVRVGRPVAANARSADARADAERPPRRDGTRRTRGGNRRSVLQTAEDRARFAAAFPTDAAPIRCRTSSRRSPRSSARWSRAARRSTAISISDDRAALSPVRPEGNGAVLLHPAALQRVPRRLQSVGTGRLRRAPKHIRRRCSTTPVSTTSMAPVRIRPRIED